ncbi:MAG TPA: LEA type 2 family protein [Phycisphaerae bacterium]|nr:LEA type 2 family protein [Phycisphaerae bacterium]
MPRSTVDRILGLKAVCICGVMGCSLAGMLAGCAEAKPRIDSVTPRITGIDWRGVDVTFDIAVKNPLPIQLRAPGGHYAIEVGNSEIARADDVPPIAVASRSRGIVPLPARFEYTEVLALIRDGQDADEIPYRISGALALEAAGVSVEAPFSHDGELPVLQMPSIEVTGLKQGSVGFGGVHVTVGADLENPNVFAVGVSDLRFELTIAGARVADVKVDAPDGLRAHSKSHIELVAEVAGVDAIASVVTSPSAAEVQLRLRGELDTPFGKVALARE